MTIKENVFRRQFRIAEPADAASLDALVIRQLQRLENDSPFRMQEWIRSALRKAYLEEAIALGGSSEELRTALEKVSLRGLA